MGKMKKPSREFVAIGVIVLEILLIALYQITVAEQFQYFFFSSSPDSVPFRNGIHYGLIALNPLRFYPFILATIGVVLAGIFWGFTKNARIAFALSLMQILIAMLGIAYLFFGSASGEMTYRLEVESKTYFLVNMSGINSYLLGCDGTWGSCDVLGSIKAAH
jgi:hypothetical protein